MPRKTKLQGQNLNKPMQKLKPWPCKKRKEGLISLLKPHSVPNHNHQPPFNKFWQVLTYFCKILKFCAYLDNHVIVGLSYVHRPRRCTLFLDIFWPKKDHHWIHNGEDMHPVNFLRFLRQTGQWKGKKNTQKMMFLRSFWAWCCT